MLTTNQPTQIIHRFKYAYGDLSQQQKILSSTRWSQFECPWAKGLLLVMPCLVNVWVNFSREPSHSGISYVFSLRQDDRSNLVCLSKHIDYSVRKERLWNGGQRLPKLIHPLLITSHCFTMGNKKFFTVLLQMWVYILQSRKKNLVFTSWKSTS